MHVVIGGYGRVGRYLAHELEERGHTVSVIDRNAGVFEEIDRINGRRLAGEVFDRDTLIKAGIERADAFAAVTSGDNSNIVSARVARERFGVERVVARIFDPRRAAIYEQFDIPTVSVVQWAAVRLLASLLGPELRSEHAFGPEGDVVMIDLAVPEEAVGKRVMDLELPRLMHIVAIDRDGRSFLPADIDTVHAGDRAHVVVRSESLHEVDKLFAGKAGE